MRVVFFVSLAVASVVYGNPVDITAATFDTLVYESGKGAFVKFYAPWCGHCKALKPTWDQLGDAFASSPTVLIGDVDCTVEEELCTRFTVEGYPTLKFFAADTGPIGEDYDGAMEFDELKAFAEENLGPSCDLDHKDLCTPEQVLELEATLALGEPAIEKEIAEIEAELAESDERFEAELEKLQAAYEMLEAQREEHTNASAPRLRLLYKVKSSFESGEPAEPATKEEL